MSDREKLADELATLKHERGVLQKICARRSDVLEAVGLHADATIEEAAALRAGPAQTQAQEPFAWVILSEETGNTRMWTRNGDIAKAFAAKHQLECIKLYRTAPQPQSPALKVELDRAKSNHKSVVESKRRTELRLKATLAALQQIYTVCNDNAGENCDQRMTVNFIREVACDAFEKATTRLVTDAALALTAPQSQHGGMGEALREIETDLRAYIEGLKPGSDLRAVLELTADRAKRALASPEQRESVDTNDAVYAAYLGISVLCSMCKAAGLTLAEQRARDLLVELDTAFPGLAGRAALRGTAK